MCQCRVTIIWRTPAPAYAYFLVCGHEVREIRILVIDGWGISCAVALVWMLLDFTDDQSTLVQAMAWCRQATSHYLGLCWPKSLSPYGVTRPQRVLKRVSELLPATCWSDTWLCQNTNKILPIVLSNQMCPLSYWTMDCVFNVALNIHTYLWTHKNKGGCGKLRINFWVMPIRRWSLSGIECFRQ